MAGVIFSHPGVPGALRLRLPPSEVDWSYNLNTSTTSTYGGQVVQLLSLNFDRLTISGRFGKEGAHGVIIQDGERTARTSTSWNTKAPYGVGLIQMTAWFQYYFQIASQGTGRSTERDQHYDQTPVTLTYQGTLNGIRVDAGKSEKIWKVYPVSFPSYKRANDAFAPEWRVECEVAEAPNSIKEQESVAAIDRLKYKDRYEPFNPFSDPAGMGGTAYTNLSRDKKQAVLDQAAQDTARKDSQDIVDFYNQIQGEVATSDLSELIQQSASLPATVAAKSQNAGKLIGKDRIKEAGGRVRLTDDALRITNG